MARISDRPLDDLFLHYAPAWADKMEEIWQEQIVRLEINHTGTLFRSFAHSLQAASAGMTIEMRFAEYGQYVDSGAGREMGFASRPFLDKEYRRAHRLDKPRRVGPAWGGEEAGGRVRPTRRWFARAWYRSVYAISEAAKRIAADSFVRSITDRRQ